MLQSMALDQAAMHGNVAYVKQLLAGGVAVCYYPWFSRTPLHNAVFQRHLEVVELLLLQTGALLVR